MNSEEWATSVYIKELANQAEAAQIAAEDLNAALALALAGIPRAFAAIQGLLAAGAMISKLLWPKPSSLNEDGSQLSPEDANRRAATLERGRRLRRELKIKGIPILENRKVRNAFEHFDDRLDRYFHEGETNVVDRVIGPRRTTVVINDKPARYLRAIDPETGTVSVMEDEVGMQELFDATADVGRRATDWLSQHRR